MIKNTLRSALMKLIKNNARKILSVSDMYEQFTDYYNLSDYQLEDDPKYPQTRYKHEIRSILARLVKEGLVIRLERNQYTGKNYQK